MKLLIEVGGLVAGISKVEHIVGLLRIEHQRILVAPLHDVIHVLPYLLVLLLEVARLPHLFPMIRGEFAAQYRQRLVQVFFLQHGSGGQGHEQHCKQ